MELTDEEKKIVMEHRRSMARAWRNERDAMHLLDTASRFRQWLEENGAGATFSTFCDNFGYESREGEDRARLYNNVMSIIGAARELTRQ